MTFVTVKTFQHAHEAIVAKSFLENEGVAAFVKDELSFQNGSFFSKSINSVKLQVHEKDLEIAKELLLEFMECPSNDKLSNQVKIYKQSEINENQCPNCQSSNFARANVPKVIAWLLLGLTNLPFFMSKRSFYCFDCNYKWKVK